MGSDERGISRRRFLRVGVASTVGMAVGIRLQGSRWGTNGNETSSIIDGPRVELNPVITDLRQPVEMVFPRDDPSVRLVANKSGTVYRHDADGLQDQPFLDVSDQLADLKSWEMGLLGLELHPRFQSNGKCYARYSAPLSSDAPNDYSHTFVLSEFTATADRRRVDPASERVLLALPEPGNNHNGGSITFGPDGYLYVATGDGLSGDNGAGRGQASDWYLINRGGNGQNLTDNLYGSILRIDVDARDDDKPYAIPEDNPLVGKTGLDEQWAWGFRNPFKISFGPDGRLFVGDVGENRFEEINIVHRGSNYGWNVREGKQCIANRYLNYAISKMPSFESNWPACPRSTPDGNPLVDAVAIYPHRRDGKPYARAVIGGYVFENETVPDLQGKYVFGDFLGNGRSGRLFATSSSGEGLWQIEELQPTVDGDPFQKYILSFARDPHGGLYVLASTLTDGSGTVYRLGSPS